MTTVKLEATQRHSRRLSFTVSMGHQRFTCSYRFQDICFYQLEKTYGKPSIDWLCFHIIALEMAKFCSLAPEKIDFGQLKHFCTPEFFQFWKTIVHHIWSQWRYQNNQPDYTGPELSHPLSTQRFNSIKKRDIQCQHLLFCGGGKDSLVAMRTLDYHGISYGTFAYTHSTYGEHIQQYALLKQQIEQTHSQALHIQMIEDELMNFNHLPVESGNTAVFNITHAETPCSIFGSLPLMLMQGYRNAVLAHERSADVGNLVWMETGEEINHQWGKSWEAEKLINRYINRYLIQDFSYYSLLKPVTDVVIFNLLQKEQSKLSHIHSCNIEKPWCKKCAKCAYVWLSLKAYLPNDIVDDVFGIDLFDIPENEIWFRQMLGLEEHTPFECIGQIPEARLALELYLKNNDHPKARQLRSEFEEDFAEITQSMTTPVFINSNLAPELRDLITRYYRVETESIKNRILGRLRSQVEQLTA